MMSNGINQRFFAIVVFVLCVQMIWQPVSAQTDNSLAQEKEILFETINLRRETNDLSELIYDNQLAYAAQHHADYLAEINGLSETGIGGETVRNRALDVGYGGDAAFTVSQNMAMGWQDTEADYLVNTLWPKTQTSLRNLMLSKNQHVGIGITERNKRSYIVVMFGYINDGTLLYTPLPTYDYRTPKPEKSYTPTPVPLSTALEDGSINHIVQNGETLSDISFDYDVDWNTLANLNNLNLEIPLIYEGQSLLIRPAFTATMTPTITNTPRPPTRTPRPTYTADMVIIAEQTFQAMITPTVTTQALLSLDVFTKAGQYKQALGIILVIISSLGLLVVFLKHKQNTD